MARDGSINTSAQGPTTLISSRALQLLLSVGIVRGTECNGQQEQSVIIQVADKCHSLWRGGEGNMSDCTVGQRAEVITDYFLIGMETRRLAD